MSFPAPSPKAARDIFPWPFSLGTGHRAEASGLENQFGEGYIQEGPDGMTPVLPDFTLVLDKKGTHESITIEKWIVYHARTKRRFFIVHPDAGTLHKLSVRSYSWDPPTGNLRRFEIVCREVKEWP